LPNPNHFLPGPGLSGLVSVIIPCYNRAYIVRQTIDSVLAQTYANFEAVVIDDGSTDNTREVVTGYTDRRIRFFHKTNGGLSSARNAGLDVARGEFVAFLDSDDAWHPWKLAAQVEIFRRHPEAGLIWSDMSTFVKDGEILSERHLRAYYSVYDGVDFERNHKRAGILSDLLADAPPNFAGCPYYVADVFQDMFGGNLVHPPTAIVRRERLKRSGPFEPEVTGLGAEDYHFYFGVSAHGPVAFLDAPTTLYRVHPSQMSTCNRLHEARGNLNVLLHWLHRHPLAVPDARIRGRLARSHAWLGAEELYAGNQRDAIRHLWQSLRLQLKQPAIAALLMISLLPQAVTRALRSWKRALHGVVDRPILGFVLILTNQQEWLYDLISVLQPDLAGM
jgi:hypothetical protein